MPDQKMLDKCLSSAKMGVLLSNCDALPVLFAYQNGKIYISGYPGGIEILDMKDGLLDVNFIVQKNLEIVYEENSAHIKNARLHSDNIQIKGKARLLTGIEAKKEVLTSIAKKYMEVDAKKSISYHSVINTQVIEIIPTGFTLPS